MNQNFFAARAALKTSSASMYRGMINLAVALFVFTIVTSEVFGQNLITVPFTNGFVGLNTGNNSAGSCYYFSGAQGLGWTNIQFAQNSPTNIFVAQGNDIIGSVLITDFNGVEYEIPGFIKWRAPSGQVTTMVFEPSAGSVFSLATNGFNGSNSYSINSTNYLGLTFNGQTLSISPVPGTVTGNAATSGLLDELNGYLQSFVSLSVNNVTVNETAGTVSMQILLSGTSTQTITVNYILTNGTANSSEDFTSQSGILSFAPGQSSLTVTTNILNDALTEGIETFSLILSDPANASISDGEGVVTIIDDEGGLNISNVSAIESCDNYVEFLVSGAPGTYLILGFSNGTAVGGGQDFGSGVGNNLEIFNGTVWIPYSNYTSIPATGFFYVRTPLISDGISESNENFMLEATEVSSTIASYSIYDVNFQTIDLSGWSLISGTAEQVNAIYRKTNAITIAGQGIDVRATITARSNVGTTGSAFDFDNDASNITRFQPEINSTSASGSYVDFSFKFYLTGTTTQVALENFYVTGVDIDGLSASATEFIELNNLSSYTVDNACQLTITPEFRPGFTRFLGISTGLANITFENTAAFIANYFDPVPELNMRAGVSGSSSSARLFSIAFGSSIGSFSTPSNTESNNVVSGSATIQDAPTEVCNGIDDNCNGQIDEGLLLTFYADTDGDGFGNPSSSVQACSAPSGYVSNNTDCNDASASINPNTVWYLDADGDGYYVSTSTSCTSPGANYNTTGGINGDCNDNNAAVNAAATEVCNTIDDNCNGQIDEGVLLTFYADTDGDGFGDAESTTLACTAPEGYVTDNTDCDDASATVYPGATEQCNSIDDNCNTLIDDGVVFITYYADADGDGFGGSTSVVSCAQPEGYVTDNTDCDDASATVYPGATEICNTIDDNCNGQIDEGVLLTFYADADVDGFGDAGSTTLACTAPEGYVTDNTDCDDASATVYPGATEVCNTIDDNCNGQIDEGVLLTFYADADGDGFGDAGSTTLACTAPEGYVTDNTDCDDASATVYPGATEICNTIDDNCNGQIDEGVLLTFYADADGDGFGDAGSTTLACTAPEGYVTDNTDCDDASATVYPGATEQCNSIDDNCNTLIDDGVVFITYYADADGDGFGGSTSVVACAQPEGYVTDNTDCDDASATVYPGATEICNTIDDNCNGQIDEGVLLTFYADTDGDGFGDAGLTTLACTAPEGYVTDNTDCDDTDALNDSNSAPFAANTEITIETHQGFTSISLAELVSDAAGDVLNFTVVENANVSLVGSDLNVTWSTDFAGTLSITYVVCDQGGNSCDPEIECDTAAVTVFVYNGNPLAINDAAFTNEDEQVTVSVTDNDSDTDGTINTATVDLDPNTEGIQTEFTTTNGQWNVDGNGLLTFTPNSNFNGVDSLNYVVQDNDGLFSNEATVVITVNAINDQVQANDDNANVVEGSTSIIDVASNDTDTDGVVDVNTIEIITLPSHGNASVNVNGQIEFIPNSNFDGLDSLAYVICDNGLPLPAQCDTAWVYITISSCVSNPANDCDNDGLTNEEEENNGTDPLNPDSDGDGVIDGTEVADNTNPIDPCNLVLASVSVTQSEAWYALDCDGDSIPNGEENGTDPLNEDSDGDGVSDSDEIQDSTNPNDPCSLILASVTLTPSTEWYTLDCDGDSIPNGEENGTDPLSEDTDGDGVSDNDEIQDGTNPNDPCSLILASVTLTPSPEWFTLDCDGDSIPNGEENGTDSLSEDTDGDGVSDSDEVQDGTNPNDPCSLILASVTLTPSLEWYTLDCDGDSILNGEESGTDPLSEDTDGDGVSDSDELQDVTNPLDPCSLILASVTLTPSPEWYTLDCDGDSIPNGEENGTDPLNPDTDGDGVTDADEIQDGTDPTNPCEFLPESITVQVDSSWFEVDCDNDGLTNGEELIGNLEWNDPDTDGDGVLDGTEIIDGTSPLDPCSLLVASITLTPEFDWIALDCDNDGLDNGAELSNNTNPLNPDTDGDGVTDGAEVGDITNPLDPCEYVVSSVTLTPSANWYALDCDGDSLSNGDELVNNIDVFNPDTDGDGVTDGTEVADNTIPTDPCSLVLTSISLTPIASWVDLDCDNDDLTNGDEVAYNTDPFNPDTDGDGVVDGVEVADATIPTDPCSLTFASITLEPSIAWGDLDCDGDSITNAEELIGGIDPFNPDTDGDGVTDGTEAIDGTDPLDPCSYVFTSQTLDPSTEWENLDCDGDGLTNLEEANGGSDPNDPCSPVPCDIMIPQAITPNGDGFNDVLIINGIENYPDHELIIFNRWGAEVFRATAYQNDWNGNSQSNLNVGGDELPSGTYYYLFDTKVEGNEVMKGFIYLKR